MRRLSWLAQHRPLIAFFLFVIFCLAAASWISPVWVLDATDHGDRFEARAEGGSRDGEDDGCQGGQGNLDELSKTGEIGEAARGGPDGVDRGGLSAAELGLGDGVDPREAIMAAAAEIEWLMSCQLPNGAIAQTPAGVLVIPYFANLAARQLAEGDPEACLRYMDWYIENLNMPDRWGLSGTVYDFSLQGEELLPTRRYDSADSYASTFLSLVARYYRVTGDGDYVKSNKSSIDTVASVLHTLQDEDGLVRVAPNSGTKYLMDNAEDYRGLMDWADTLESLGYTDECDRYRLMAEAISDGIETVLKRPGGDDYAWSFSWLGKRYPRRSRWYPDAVSQVFLISLGIIPPDDSRAVAIWDRFNAEFPKWYQGETDDRFPWAEMAVASVMMNDTNRANRFLAWVADEYAERQYPWHVLESSNRVKVESMLSSTLGITGGE
mgnify:CR=1 FL=1